MKQITIGAGSSLDISEINAVANGAAKVALTEKNRSLLATRRRSIEEFITKSREPAYGFNRGFGHNVDLSVSPDRLADLQRNLIRSHSSGVGAPTDRPIVRATMLLRAHSLAQGFSGVRPEVVEKLIEFLNLDICPLVPEFGSVGASGDLAPLSHIALSLMGEGKVIDTEGGSSPTKEILKKKKISALTLEMKEGLALSNGVQFSNACGIIAAEKCRRLLRTAVIATAISGQVLLGGDDAYDGDLLNLRPHSGSLVVGKWLRELFKNSPIRSSHRPYSVDGEIQDPYNLRCAPQILGSIYDLIENAATSFETEANSVTDNPLILPQKDSKGQFTRIISGGHFHGMPVAISLYNLVQAICIMSRLSNMRCVRFVDQARNKGLGSDLVWPGLSDEEIATSSGMMIPEYVSAALTNSLWGDAMPSHLFSLSTDAGQEDHVSMSATLAVRVLKMLPKIADVLAIELAFGAQGAHIRRASETIPSKRAIHLERTPESTKFLKKVSKQIKIELKSSKFVPDLSIHMRYKLEPKQRRLSVPCEKVLSFINGIFPKVERDRELSSQLQKLGAAVLEGSIERRSGFKFGELSKK